MPSLVEVSQILISVSSVFACHKFLKTNMDFKSLQFRGSENFLLTRNVQNIWPCWSCLTLTMDFNTSFWMLFKWLEVVTFSPLYCNQCLTIFFLLNTKPCFRAQSCSQQMAQKPLNHRKGWAGQGPVASYEPSSYSSHLAWGLSLQCTCSTLFFLCYLHATFITFSFISPVDLCWFLAAVFLSFQGWIPPRL